MADGLALGLAAALCWGSTDICAALAARRIGGFATAALVQVTSLGGILLVALLSGASLPADRVYLALAAGIGVLSAVSYLSFYVALRLGPMAVVAPVGSAYGAIAVLLSALVLGESPSVLQAMGVVLATGGVLSISLVLDGRAGTAARFVGPGVPFVIVALVLWGLMTVGMTELVREADLVGGLLVARTTTSLVVWTAVGFRAVARRRRGMRGPGLDRPALAVSLAAGALDITGIFAFASGLRVAPAWLVGISSSFGPAVAFLFAVGFLGDRLRPVQWLGLAALAAGLVLIGLP